MKKNGWNAYYQVNPLATENRKTGKSESSVWFGIFFSILICLMCLALASCDKKPRGTFDLRPDRDYHGGEAL